MREVGMTHLGLALSAPHEKPIGLFMMTNSFETGGTEKQFAALAQSFEATRLRPRIGCIARRGSFLEGFNEVAEFPVGGNLYGIGSMRARWRLARYLRRSNVAIAHAFDFYTNILMIPAAMIARIPAVLGSQRQLGDLLSPARSLAQLAMLRCCDRVVCNSRVAAARLVEQGLPHAKISIIGNGLPPSTFDQATPAFPRPSSQLRIGMIARMNSESKNHRVFLRAAAKIHNRLPETEFILAGDGPLRWEFEHLASELGIKHRVQFLGDRRDIPAILASMDISVCPSASESLSNAILESMAAGVPIVAANVGGNPELITRDRGILVPAGNEDFLADAIQRLIANPGIRLEFGRRAKMFAESNFTIAAISKRYRELYEEVLDTKGHRQKQPAFPGGRDGQIGRRHRVAIICPSSRYVGGQSVQADLLVESWHNDSDIDASIVPIDPSFPKILKWAEAIPLLRTFIRQPFYLWSLWLGLEKADIAHIFSASYWSFFLAPTPAMLIAHLRGKKALIHYHSGEARDHLHNFLLARPLLSRADRLVVPSAYLVNVFAEFGLTAQAVPNIVSSSQFCFRPRAPLRPHLVCTRGFHPYYSVDVVVRAFGVVKQAYPDARLDLLGNGPLEPQIRSLVRHLNLEDVSFVGIVPRNQIGDFYDQADIFINASCLDNMPVSILEAFASGIPVVSTEPEGMRFLVEHERTGLLCQPGDWRALATNVIRLLEDPALAALIVANAHEQCSAYHWRTVRSQWLNIYRSLILNGTPHSDNLRTQDAAAS